ncbi:hypothetical protein Ahy_A07g034245 isoform B [Arachis hypogaea]|uniref:Aminotransferase-like plant mobile domain-containing protein n=1 Tax=Arachis hypogaea TaxID=3818 RepID=A0A445CBD0_ARAHY|nr:hypothetical protein Ahy_A07g034245 isoform B [Arachis hypogaea]
MEFFLPTTINKVSLVHLIQIFQLDNITECNWGSHVFNFIIKGITNHRLKKKKSIDSCLYALMIKGEAIPGLPQVSHWNRELMVARIRAEIDGHMAFFANDCLLSRMVSRKMKQIVEDSSSERESESDDE